MTATATKPAQPRNSDKPNGAPEVTQHPAPDSDSKAMIAAVLEGKAATFTPLAEQKEITLTIGLVKKFLCHPTKSGAYPTDQDCVKYIMVSMQRGLNPWVGDCYLLGYDSQKYGPQFSMVVAIQALLKRAELARTIDATPAFDGIDSGVIVERRVIGVGENGQPFDRLEIFESPGDFIVGGDKLLGGWAKVYRKDRAHPFYQRLKLATYKKNTPMWDNDPEGMIAKCASSAALREAFPSDIGGLYLASEIEAFAEDANKRVAGGDRGTVNLEHLSPTASPPAASPPATTSQMPAHDSAAAQGAAQGHQGGGYQPSSGEGPQEALGDSGPSRDQGEVSPEDELAAWEADISSAESLGVLKRLEDEAIGTASETVKPKALRLIAERREAIAKLAKGGKQAALPGAGA